MVVAVAPAALAVRALALAPEAGAVPDSGATTGALSAAPWASGAGAPVFAPIPATWIGVAAVGAGALGSEEGRAAALTTEVAAPESKAWPARMIDAAVSTCGASTTGADAELATPG